VRVEVPVRPEVISETTQTGGVARAVRAAEGKMKKMPETYCLRRARVSASALARGTLADARLAQRRQSRSNSRTVFGAFFFLVT